MKKLNAEIMNRCDRYDDMFCNDFDTEPLVQGVGSENPWRGSLTIDDLTDGDYDNTVFKTIYFGVMRSGLEMFGEQASAVAFITNLIVL